MTRVYLGRLNSSVRERDVEKFFRDYGKLKEVTLKGTFGFVEFDDSRDAEDAVYDLNNKELCGDRIIVEFARNRREARGRGDDRYGRSRGGRSSGGGGGGGPAAGYGSAPVRTDYRLYINNLSSRVSWQDLKDYIRNKTDISVSYADAHKQSVGQAIVEFDSKDDLRYAIKKLDNTEINGKKITVSRDGGDSRSPIASRSPRGRRGSYSRSPKRRHSRSRSRSRTRSRSSSRSRPRSSGEERSRRETSRGSDRDGGDNSGQQED
ncbi:Serine/arginine-rich splicing factor 4 [Trichoplax sp. H2]|uniref:RRM domain-containing protein n=1 Tax=Trichoplax adhaerens TaxID=10228 RepID=B3S0L3_TRIAD|nr:expressed hypothetical protein [Trichoplax adhaerens]EDV24030.1 expressed hypothetical protein [Trichoplax adhaerens]RDD44906.1 Serine/arginine-rich splicing factor 4 [Trichoplax sp. H2]|eukprot:XP_002113556.1 expressed hypothetical protein [Trichoplax adhaerens]